MAHDDLVAPVTERIAALAQQYMGVDRALILSGTPLAELMDSLCVLELVMLLEREWGVNIDIPSSRLPACAPIDAAGLAGLLVGARQHAIDAREARKAAREKVAA